VVVVTPAAEEWRRGQLIAYVLIVLVAALGFAVTEHNMNVASDRAVASRQALCRVAKQNNDASRILVQQIVDLVVKNSPRRTPSEIKAADKSTAIILQFQQTTLELLGPTPNCADIAAGVAP
jgi:hypothetical protein